jgi:hypothetical protein
MLLRPAPGLDHHRDPGVRAEAGGSHLEPQSVTGRRHDLEGRRREVQGSAGALAGSGYPQPRDALRGYGALRDRLTGHDPARRQGHRAGADDGEEALR